MAEPPELSVVVPAYNESGRLPETLSIIKPYLNGLGLRWELIIVNDGSSDRTMDLIRTEEGLDPSHVRGIDLQPNGGKGRAVAAGVAATQGELVLISWAGRHCRRGCPCWACLPLLARLLRLASPANNRPHIHPSAAIATFSQLPGFHT